MRSQTNVSHLKYKYTKAQQPAKYFFILANQGRSKQIKSYDTSKKSNKVLQV